jgi:hypothetical protein
MKVHLEPALCCQKIMNLKISTVDPARTPVAPGHHRWAQGWLPIFPALLGQPWLGEVSHRVDTWCDGGKKVWFPWLVWAGLPGRCCYMIPEPLEIPGTAEFLNSVQSARLGRENDSLRIQFHPQQGTHVPM